MVSCNDKLKYILETKYVDCTNEEPALHQAVIRNDLEVLKLFIKCKTDINIVDRHGRLPIAYVKEYSQLEVVKLLLAAGSNIYQLDELGTMQFSMTFRSGHEAVIKEYLKYKMNLNMPDSHGQTAIHYLMYNTCRSLMYNISVLSCNVNIKDLRGQTPMMLAIKNENLSWVELLLQKRANVNHIFELQSIPIYGLIRYFCDDSDTQAWPSGCSKFMIECLGLLIAEGAEVNSIFYGSYTVLKLALKKFNFKKVNKILRRLALIETSGSSIIEINRKTIEQHPKAKSYYSELIAELKRMMELKLHVGVSFFNILFEENMNTLAKYFKNKRLVDIQNNFNKFPKFYDILVGKYDEGMKRMIQISKQEKMLNEIFYLKFPPLVIRKIAIDCFPAFDTDDSWFY